MNRPLENQPVKVDTVVQDYMDSLLADLFPEVEVAPNLDQPPKNEIKIEKVEETVVEKNEFIKSSPAPTALEPLLAVSEKVPAKPEPSAKVRAAHKLLDDLDLTLSKTVVEPEVDPQGAKQKVSTQEVQPAVETQSKIQSEMQSELVPAPKTSPALNPTPKSDPVSELSEQLATIQTQEELHYPDAPSWAQQEFDVLLFDVCGLKLAVSMESLGRIIKVDHETNQLIGRPSWFMGAYNENEQHLYVVDTAKFIMPEKGYDLSEQGFEYIIQLQRSQWTLACKEVYSTVRISPDKVKWRSTQGKRRWLAGTVIEHMCALIHVDALVELLESENT